MVLVDLGGLEPPTSRLSGVRSNQLSYRSIPNNVYEHICKSCPYMAGVAGFEPTTFGFGDRRSTTELHPFTYGASSRNRTSDT